MAAVAITTLTIAKTGYNLTDSADFEVLVAGAGNGVSITYDPQDIVILRNPTGGNAVFTIKATQLTEYSDLGITIPDQTVTVATLDDWLFRMSAIHASSGSVTIECDVAGEVLVVQATG